MINIKGCITLSFWLFSTIGCTQSLDINNLCFTKEPICFYSTSSSCTLNKG